MEILYITRYFDTIETIHEFKVKGLMSTIDTINFDAYFKSKNKAIDQLKQYSLFMLKYHLGHKTTQRNQQIVLEEWVPSEGRYILSASHCYAEIKDKVYHDYSAIDRTFQTI